MRRSATSRSTRRESSQAQAVMAPTCSPWLRQLRDKTYVEYRIDERG